MTITCTCEPEPAQIAIHSFCTQPLPSVNSPPMTYFWLRCFLLRSFLCVLPLTCPHTDPTATPACYLYSSTIDVHYPRKRCPDLPQTSFSPYLLVSLLEDLAGTKHSRYFNSTADSLPQRKRCHF